MRLFLAVTLPLELLDAIEAAQKGLQAALTDPGVRWTKPDQFHYTLKFLGEQKLERVYKAIDVARAVGDRYPPFELTLGGLGCFPNPERPSILWLGAERGGEELLALAQGLDAELARYRFLKENKPPKAHLTLARIKSYQAEEQAARVFPALPPPSVGAFTITDFALMQSILHPTGPVYKVIERFDLRGQASQ